jgi:hypothetical protein
MGARSRSRDLASTGAGFVKSETGATILTGFSGVTSDESCADITMPYPFTTDHSLTIIKREVLPLRFNGNVSSNVSGTVRRNFLDYNPQGRSSVAFTPSASAVNFPYWKTKALAGMNPSKPKVNVPLFLFELREFPKMLRDLGNVLRGKIRPQDVPGGYLAYKFGWAPLVKDLLELMKFTKATEARMAYLRKLESGNRIQRELFSGPTQDSVSLTETTGVALLKGGFAYRYRTRTREDLDVWFTANAQLKFALPETSGLRSLSRRIVTGLAFRPYTVWDYLPWSWLIDYGINVGDYIEAQDGLTQMGVTRLCIMARTTITTTICDVKLDPALNASDSVMKTVKKQRSVSQNPTPQMTHTPFLDKGQMAILAALVTARALRGARM